MSNLETFIKGAKTLHAELNGSVRTINEKNIKSYIRSGHTILNEKGEKLTLEPKSKNEIALEKEVAALKAELEKLKGKAPTGAAPKTEAKADDKK